MNTTKDKFILHEDPVSGNCYKIRLTASIVGVTLERRSYDIYKGETRTTEFLQNISSFGRIPVLQIGSSACLPESNAACHYLADITGSTLIPSDPLQKAEMLRWMFFEQNQHEISIATLRAWTKFIGLDNLDEGRKAQVEGKRRAGRDVLDCMDEHLEKSKSGWFVGNSVTLADICLYAYTHVAADAEYDLTTWPAVQKWCQNMTKVPGYSKW